MTAPKHLQAMAAAIKDVGVMPELEVFEKGARIIEVLGDHVATPNDARQILGLS